MLAESGENKSVEANEGFTLSPRAKGESLIDTALSEQVQQPTQR